MVLVFFFRIFFLHHANVDSIWWQWQQADKQRLTAFGGNVSFVDSVV